VLALALAAGAVPVVSANLYALVAAVFVGLPFWWVGRAKLDPARLGMTWKGWPRGLGWGLLFTVGTLAPFAVGQYVWETQFQGRTFSYSTERYHRWPVEYEGAQDGWGKEAGLWVWSKRDRLFVGARSDRELSGKALLTAEVPFKPRPEGPGVILRPVDAAGKKKPNRGLSRRWEMLPTTRSRRVLASVSAVDFKGEPGPRVVTVEAKPAREGLGTWEVRAGPAGERVEGDEIELERTLIWMALWGLTQLLFIALPEEYFYRGYVQTRLSDAAKARGGGEERAWLGFTWAMVWTSALFAIGHLLIPVNGVLLAQRAAVFFPSLVFGWLRAKTGSIVASTLYHAACNLMVLFTAIHFI
jgi:membrane protease YdiL (CAAX protease family)